MFPREKEKGNNYLGLFVVRFHGIMVWMIQEKNLRYSIPGNGVSGN